MNRPLRVFLCHSSNDKPAVRELYQKLRAEPWIQPWLDEEELYPGQDWNMEIEKAVEAADAIIVCLTKNSISKEGYVQRELRIVLDFADYKPEGTIYILPVRLEECEPPRRLRAWQYADYFEGQRDRALERLLVSLKRRSDSLGLNYKKSKFDTEKVMNFLNNADDVSISDIGDEEILTSDLEYVNIPVLNKITLSSGMEFMCIPAGKFLMGSNNGDEDERPEHTVDIPYDYWMARFPVTNDTYNEYVLTNDIVHPASIRRLILVPKGGSETETVNWDNIKNHPLCNIDWNNTITYFQWLNGLCKDELPSGFTLRLPTEAEWEKAARGTDGRLYPWGDKFDLFRCNTQESGLKSTSPINAYSPQGDSPYGIADMLGNVWEWTQTIFKKYPYNSDDGRENLKTPGNRVLRGGSYFGEGRLYNITSRWKLASKNGGNLGGFRICLAPHLPK